MSYNYLTQYNASPSNYTPGSQTRSVWGVDRQIKNIAIHWWGDPNTNPTIEGVIAHFEDPNAQVSAHFVVTGTGRRAAQLVNFDDNSWATNSDNPYSISIECDPRCRDEDYDTIAEVISQIRSAYGDLPLVPHKQFVSTACPGNYDLNRLDKLARTKDGSGDWGTVTDINAAHPVVTPPVEAVHEVSRDVFDPLKQFKFNKDSRLYNVLDYTTNGQTVYPAGQEIDIKQRLTLSNGNVWYRTQYSSDKELATGFRAEDLTEVVVDTTPPPVDTPPADTGTQTPPDTTQSSPTVSLDEKSTTLLQDLQKLIQSLLDALKSIFKIGE